MLLQSVLVCHDEKKFMGFPANAGLWWWDDEILAAFYAGDYDEDALTHKVDLGRPIVIGLARSLDAGKTWQVEMGNEINAVSNRAPVPIPREGIHFAHPHFALKVGRASIRIHSDTFMVSYDRGHTWQGPYLLPEAPDEITARTDYIVESDSSCMMMLSHRDERVPCTHHPDRAYAVRTDDGGRTWRQLGYITDMQARSVMPCTVRMSDGRLITALSRRRDLEPVRAVDWREAKTDNWIEVRESTDGGQTWGFLSRIDATWNMTYPYGNPVALSRLPDGRMIMFFGRRTQDARLVGIISADGGRTWSEDIVLAEGFTSSDMGYPRVANLRFGKMVIVFYGATERRPQEHIEAVRWMLD